MSIEFYKWLHISSLMLVLMSLGAMAGLAFSQKVLPKGKRIGLALSHGIALTLVLISGFGMAGKLGLMTDMPTWIYVKLGLWLVLGGSLALAKRQGQSTLFLILIWTAVGSFGAYLALFKPMF